MEELRNRIVELTRDLILIPSSVTRPDDRETCFNFVRYHFEGLEGVRICEFRDGGYPSVLFLPEKIDCPQILFCAHLDVVAHADITSYRSRIEEGRIYGPGAGDMKGALAILLELFKRLHVAYPGISLGLAVTSDEETGGEHGIGYLFDQVGIRCASAMIPDGGTLNEITVEEKGILHLNIHAEGRTAHAARPWLGENPLQKIMDSLTRIKAYFDSLQEKSEDHWYPTCAITILNTSNETINCIPSSAEVSLDVRFPKPYTAKGLTAEVEMRLEKGLKLTHLISDEPAHLSPDPLFVEICEKVTGEPVSLTREAGGSDARFLCRYDIPVMMARPLVGNVHAEDEWIDIDSMVKFYQICEEYITSKLVES